MKKILITLLFTCWALQSHATIVDNGTYTTVNGLDWLDLTRTNNKTLDEALFDNPGWVLATKSQYQSMMSQFYTIFHDEQIEDDNKYINYTAPGTILGVPGEVTWKENTWWGGISHHAKRYRTEDFKTNLFNEYFGLTHADSGPSIFTNQQSTGIYYDAGKLRGGGLEASWLPQPNNSSEYVEVWWGTDWDFTSEVMTSGIDDFGMFLVRAATEDQTPRSSVPTPSPLLLMCLGLLGFGAHRRNYLKI